MRLLPDAYSTEAVVDEGRMQVLHDDPYGLQHRISDAVTAQ